MALAKRQHFGVYTATKFALDGLTGMISGMRSVKATSVSPLSRKAQCSVYLLGTGVLQKEGRTCNVKVTAVYPGGTGVCEIVKQPVLALMKLNDKYATSCIIL